MNRPSRIGRWGVAAVLAVGSFVIPAGPAHAATTGAVPAGAVRTDTAPPGTPPSQRRAGTAVKTGRYAPKGLPPVGAVPPKVTAANVEFEYASAYQYGAADGIFGYATVWRPNLATGDYHSLAELSAESDRDGNHVVEVGWTVDRGLNGDANPHLFVDHWVDGVVACYNGCGFVQYSSTVYPGMTLSIGFTAQFFGIYHYQGNWWVAYGSEWVGYFPDSLWGGRYTQVGVSQWFGEVALAGLPTCTDMGNMAYAFNSSAASITNIGFYNGPAVNISTFITAPALYTVLATGSASMRYGGPGSC